MRKGDRISSFQRAETLPQSNMNPHQSTVYLPVIRDLKERLESLKNNYGHPSRVIFAIPGEGFL